MDNLGQEGRGSQKKGPEKSSVMALTRSKGAEPELERSGDSC